MAAALVLCLWAVAASGAHGSESSALEAGGDDYLRLPRGPAADRTVAQREADRSVALMRRMELSVPSRLQPWTSKTMNEAMLEEVTQNRHSRWPSSHQAVREWQAAKRHPSLDASVAIAVLVFVALLVWYCRPTQPFRTPFKVTKLAGFLVLLAFESAWSLLLFLVLRGASIFTSWRVALVVAFLATPLIYGIYLLFAWKAWSRYFASLSYRHEIQNLTCDRLPRECEVGPGECHISMRPTKIEWYGYVWCMFFIYPFFGVYALFAISLAHLTRKVIYPLGLVKKGDSKKALAEFLLNTTCALTWFKEIVETPNATGEPTPIAVFDSSFLGQVSFPAGGGGLVTRDLIQVWVDLKAGEVVEAKCDGETITVDEAQYFVLYLTSWQGHAWVHSLAMWGSDQFSPDPWVARMSLCSLFFNHLGGDGGLSVWKNITGSDINELDLSDKVPFQRPLRDFSRWRPLEPYSRFIRFVEGTRAIWFRLLDDPEFANAFSPLMDPEGHYATTILHSLDHWMLYYVYRQWNRFVLFVYDGPPCTPGQIDFRKLAELQYLGLALADDWPKLFDVYLRQSPHPFFQRVYQESVGIDPELAWNMQGCMIK